MYGPRDQFLPCAGLSLNKYGGLVGSDRFNLPQHLPEPAAVAENVFEMVFRADLVAKIKPFFGQPILRLAEFAEFERVFERDCHLARDLPQKIDVLLRKCILVPIEQVQNAERTVAAHDGQEAARLEALFCIHSERDRRERLRRGAEPQWLPRAKRRARTRAHHGQHHLILHESLSCGKIQAIDSKVRLVAIGQGKTCGVALHRVAHAAGNSAEQLR